ncbi:MAG: hypothetical protein EOQ39_18660 [Mesorhizobium sp.]|uniref:hypothetical protein n=1 Tax=Mesorhizobium sp. TaxID=1871066 RepID=UPI000FE74660|nr:hypothetical protein [Mesorhizobium sp.]RWB08807.1 MAG: hypothetical protein EOQ37_04680 [Mesorhizobium sp.]RWB13542.1 MAG: hypothetical protein EOQ39_18660 [Mesorhizobium sp.]
MPIFKVRVQQFQQEVAEAEVNAPDRATAELMVKLAIQEDTFWEDFDPDWSDGDCSHDEGVTLCP